MTTDDKNLKLALLIEPMPDCRPVITGSISGIQVFTDRSTESPKGVWRYNFKHKYTIGELLNQAIQTEVSAEECGSWQPRSFDTDELANGLLRTLLILECGFTTAIQRIESVWVEYDLLIESTDQDIRWRRSVRDAALAWFEAKEKS